MTEIKLKCYSATKPNRTTIIANIGIAIKIIMCSPLAVVLDVNQYFV